MRYIILILSLFLKKKNVEINLKANSKILIIKLDEIGDFVLAIPFIKEIKALYPSASIDLFAKENVRDLANYIPYLSNRYYLKNNLFSKGGIQKIFLFLYAIIYSLLKFKKQKYDLVIVPRWDVDSSLSVLFSFFSSAKYRLSYSEKVIDRKEKFNRNYDKFYTNLVFNNDKKHEIERYIDILKYLGVYNPNYQLEILIREIDKLFIEDETKIFDKNKIIAICPVASQSRKKWQIENYSTLSKKVIDAFDYNIVIIGGNDGRQIDDFSELQNNYGRKVIDFRGKLTLTQTAALLEKCSIYIGNDTGPMHLAAAVKTPIIEIVAHPETIDFFHTQSPERFKPWGVKSIVLYPKLTKKPCPTQMCISKESHCINNVSVEMVFEKISKLIK